MTTRNFANIVLVGALLLAPGAARAQSPVRIDVVPHAAVYAPRNELGGVAQAGGPWYLRLGRADAAPAFELEAGIRFPVLPFSLRLVGLASLPADVSGTFDCYPGLACPAILLESAAEVRVLGAVADLVWMPLPAVAPVRPFLLLGAGVKQYRYSWPAAVALVEAGKHTASSFAAHAGAGIEFGVLGQSFRVEAADWWSGEGAAIGEDPDLPGFGAPRRRPQHDLVLGIGWRMLRFQ
jgi:hypothetical protein